MNVLDQDRITFRDRRLADRLQSECAEDSGDPLQFSTHHSFKLIGQRNHEDQKHQALPGRAQ